MNTVRPHLTFIVFLLIFLVPQTASAITAREKLHEMRIPFTEQEFLNAAAKGDIAIVKLFLASGMNPNFKYEGDTTALALAAGEGHQEVVKVLLDKGANVDTKDAIGQTALWWAASYGRSEVVKVLLRNGADVNAKNIMGYTPLIVAAEQHHSDIVKLLVDKGADVSLKEKRGLTALHFAAREGQIEIAETLLEKPFLKSLIDKTTLLNAKSDAGTTPLMTAAHHGYTDIVQLLLDKGADVKATDNNGRAAWMFAAARGCTDAVNLLLEKEIELNELDEDTGPATTILHVDAETAKLGMERVRTEAFIAHLEALFAQLANSEGFKGNNSHIKSVALEDQSIILSGTIKAYTRLEELLFLSKLRLQLEHYYTSVKPREPPFPEEGVNFVLELNPFPPDLSSPPLMHPSPAATHAWQMAEAERWKGNYFYFREEYQYADRSYRNAKELYTTATEAEKTEDLFSSQSGFQQDQTQKTATWPPIRVKEVFSPKGDGQYIAIIEIDSRSRIVKQGQIFDTLEILQIDGTHNCLTIRRNDSKEQKQFCK